MDFYDFVDILEQCGWGYSDSYEVKDKTGRCGVRFEVYANSNKSSSFEALFTKIKSLAVVPDEFVASQGVYKNAPEIKSQSIIWF